jgi:hypothetical protein
MNVRDVLAAEQEPCPQWLMAVTPDGPLDMRGFLDSRTVFYPGSGVDGHPMKVFGGARAAHCFVYADYWYERSVMVGALESEVDGYGGGLRGYRPLVRFDLTAADFPVSWGPKTSRFAPASPPWSYKSAVAPYAFLQVLERLPEVDEAWGGQRLALLMMGADAFAVFEGLYCQPGGASNFYGLLLQDHGFGGNHDSFGANGLMERMANGYGVFPRWQLVASNTRPWAGFEPMEGVYPSCGSNKLRRLHMRKGCYVTA